MAIFADILPFLFKYAHIWLPNGCVEIIKSGCFSLNSFKSFIANIWFDFDDMCANGPFCESEYIFPQAHGIFLAISLYAAVVMASIGLFIISMVAMTVL